MKDLMLLLAAVTGCMNVDLGDTPNGRTGSLHQAADPGGLSDVPVGDGVGPLEPNVPRSKPRGCGLDGTPCPPEPDCGGGTPCLSMPWQEAAGLLAQGWCDRCRFGEQGCYEQLMSELVPQEGEPEPLPVCISDWEACDAQMEAELTGTCEGHAPLTACAAMFRMP